MSQGTCTAFPESGELREDGYMLSRLIVAGALFIGTCFSGYAQEIIRLWEGKAPGSETWTHQEVITTSANGIVTIRDVVDPSMTAYLPEPSTSTGIAVVVRGTAFGEKPPFVPSSRPQARVHLLVYSRTLRREIPYPLERSSAS